MGLENPALKDEFARHLKAEVISAEQGYAKVKLKVQPYFINGAGFVNGGLIFTLADYAFALAANAGGDLGLAVNASMNFIKAVSADDELSAEARLINRTRKLGTYRAEVSNKDGAVIACFQATAYFK